MVRHGTQLSVRLRKAEGERVGLVMRRDANRAFVQRVDFAAPAAAHILPFDEIVAVNCVPCLSKVHAARLLREAAATVDVQLRRSPRLLAAVMRVQEAWRNAIARRLGLVRRVLCKPVREESLGISLDAQWEFNSAIRLVRHGGLAHGILREGDRVVRIGGACVDGCRPIETARKLRQSVGRIELLLVPAARLDTAQLHCREQAARTARAEQAVAVASSECAICLSMLSEPVFWPAERGCGCEHLFCRPCLRDWASSAASQGQTPLCPLCRAPACKPHKLEERDLRVDEEVVAVLHRLHPEEYAASRRKSRVAQRL